MERLGGRVAVVTGAGKGIGRSITEAYFNEGASVVIVSRTASDLASLSESLNSRRPGAVLPIRCDVSSSEDVDEVARGASSSFGRVDVLVNNAAVSGSARSVVELTEGEWDEVMRINAKGAFLMTRAVLPLMLRQKSGNIINVSSGAGEKRPRKYVRNAAYIASKFALEGLSHALAASLKDAGINVNVLRPGLTRTPMLDAWQGDVRGKLASDVGDMLEPESVNELALYLATLRPGEITDAAYDVEKWSEKVRG